MYCTDVLPVCQKCLHLQFNGSRSHQSKGKTVAVGQWITAKWVNLWWKKAPSSSAHYPSSTLFMAQLPAENESSGIDALWTSTGPRSSHESVAVKSYIWKHVCPYLSVLTNTVPQGIMPILVGYTCHNFHPVSVSCANGWMLGCGLSDLQRWASHLRSKLGF